MAKTKELAIVDQDTSLALQYVNEDDADSGFEHQSKADTSIPYIVLCQALSPIVVEGKSKAGEWLNTVTGQTYDKEKGFQFVPATTRHYYVEWVPRDQGGGFVARHDGDSQVVRDAIKNATKFGKNKSPDGNDLVETFYVYGIVCDEDGAPEGMAVMAFKSTAIKSYRNWNAKMSQFMLQTPAGRVRPPLRAHLSRVSSRLQKNDKGQFYVPDISSVDPRGPKFSLLGQDDERRTMAKSLLDLINSGEVKDNPNLENAQSSSQDEAAPF